MSGRERGDVDPVQLTCSYNTATPVWNIRTDEMVSFQSPVPNHVYDTSVRSAWQPAARARCRLRPLAQCWSASDGSWTGPGPWRSYSWRPSGRSTSRFSVSSVWGVSTRDRFANRMIPRYEQTQICRSGNRRWAFGLRAIRPRMVERSRFRKLLSVCCSGFARQTSAFGETRFRGPALGSSAVCGQVQSDLGSIEHKR